MCRLSPILWSVSILVLMTGCATVDEVDIPPTAAGDMPSPTGAILWEHFDGYPEGLAEDVRGEKSFFSVPPSRTYLMSTLDLPRSVYDNFTQRIRGYLRPTVTGTYRIYVRGTLVGGVWLSTNEQPENARLIAKFDKTTLSGMWDGFPSQKSEPLYLESGKSYYFEGIQKNAKGSDFFIVGWAGADAPTTEIKVIKGDVLAPYFEKIGVDPALVAESYAQGYRVGYTDGQYSFPFDLSFPFKDSDKDGLPDNWEVVNGLDPKNDADALLDIDGDGLYALLEFSLGTSAIKADSDGDSIADGWEYQHKLNPLDVSDAAAIDPITGLTFAALYKKETGPEFVLRFGWEPVLVREDGSAIGGDDISALIVQYGTSIGDMTNSFEVANPQSGVIEVPVEVLGTYFVSLAVKDVNGRVSPATTPKEVTALRPE